MSRLGKVDFGVENPGVENDVKLGEMDEVCARTVATFQREQQLKIARNARGVLLDGPAEDDPGLNEWDDCKTVVSLGIRRGHQKTTFGLTGTLHDGLLSEVGFRFNISCRLFLGAAI